MGYEVVGTWRQVTHWGPLVAISTTLTITCTTLNCLTMIWPPFSTFFAFINLLIFMGCVTMILVTFFKAVFKGPGFIPYGWRPEDAKHASSMQFCDSCQGYKPPRSHHCRKCERCVMKMDHHCPWINTCCGHLNHASFCYFLFWAELGCMYALCFLVPSIYSAVYFNEEHYDYETGEQIENPIHLERPVFLVTMFSIGLSIGVAVSVSVLLYLQLKIVVKNETGIETWIIDKARDREREEAEEPFTYPYNLGRYRNLRQVFTWSGRPRSDGYTWEVVDGCHQFALTEEQLKQKAEKRQRAVLYLVTETYSGSLFPCSKGLKVALCAPCTDEPRILLRPGDTVKVTRWKKHWLYGTKLSTTLENPGKDRDRGWFPRRCAEEREAADSQAQDKKAL
ncbi:hypothetical protein ACOMHN_058593 [Nucella lapillus]